MSLGLSSVVVAGALALHPFSTGLLGRAPEPAPHPSWDEPEEPTTDPATAPPAEGTPPATDPATDPAGNPADALAPAPEPVPAPTTTPLPVVVPGPMVVTRPEPNKGIGLIAAASTTGGLAWLTAIGRMVAINKCAQAINAGDIEASFGQCLFKTTTSLLLLTPAGWVTNAATYGLAPGAGMVRGKYDGVRAAWDGAPKRNVPVFVGVGAALLGVGVIGRLATVFTFGRSIRACVGGVDACRNSLVLHYLGAQLSSAGIAAGAGLLAYGLAYKKAFTNEGSRRKAAGLADVRLAPQLGWNYTGLSVSGRF
jgi:hypothetical protein